MYRREHIVIGIKESEFVKSGKVVSPKYEFHIARHIRKKYELGDELFSISGNVILANFRLVRDLVNKINSKRNPNNSVKAGELNAAGLIDEIYHFLIRKYETETNPNVFKKTLQFLIKDHGEENITHLLFEFVSLFPPINVYQGKLSIYDYLNSFTGGKPNTEIVLEELVLLYFANFNKANKNIIELFDENYFDDKSNYRNILYALNNYFEKEKTFGPDNQDLFTFLRTPIINYPDSHEAQLNFIFEKWGIFLTDEFRRRILNSKDLIREDYILDNFGGAPTGVPKYKDVIDNPDSLLLGKSGYKYGLQSHKDYAELERFTSDTDWMPNVILIAKNVYVWLDQLSKKYNRYIHKLDQIPDEELDQLAKWNFTGLWLIGIWERSVASKKIKHVMGHLDAVASAYSLYDYKIAHDLGGEDAYGNLNQRAASRGIRLASDMVPNHTGIFSRWIIDNPEYFIQLDYSPFPSYQFTGPDLSDDPNIQLRIEDGYWSRSDAAVVFQRIDNRTGSVKYIYHGNDGTKMPWNDTAQLDMLKSEVREAVIQKILDVARMFSIIRFDAAMTLTKRHFSRLWYPQPGTGGDIPSRSDYSLSEEEFDRHFPNEFWREVVDRINHEMPNTLLLAEAFWLLEGYFVRSLGMHRVYNSAFMNMLMREENDKYRDLITNTLEFEPEILKRYVNFMSNPDEETAIKQFGTDDKYFGTAVMMVTLPGLPMFAHGQIEGFMEKYGMEYKQAYYNETPNRWFMERHVREIFPLMRKRYLFCQVRNFWFFDFIESSGTINENVFVYTNSEQGERSIIFFNNKYESTSGNVRISTPKLVEVNNPKNIETKSLIDALYLKADEKVFYIFREHISNLEFLRSGKDFADSGMNLELEASKYKIFLDFREVFDRSGEYRSLSNRLGSKGVNSIDEELRLIKLEPIHKAFENIFNENIISVLIKDYKTPKSAPEDDRYLDNIISRISNFIIVVQTHYQIDIGAENCLSNIKKQLNNLKILNVRLSSSVGRDNVFNMVGQSSLLIDNNINRSDFIIYLIWLIYTQLKTSFTLYFGKSENLFDELYLDMPIKKIFYMQNISDYDIGQKILLIRIMSDYGSDVMNLFISGKGIFRKNEKKTIKRFIAKHKIGHFEKLLEDNRVRNFLSANYYEGKWYYSKEKFEDLIDWFFILAILDYFEMADINAADKLIIKTNILRDYLKNLSLKSEFDLNLLKKNIEEPN